jgi:DOMON domain
MKNHFKWITALTVGSLLTLGFAATTTPKVDGKIDAKEYATTFKHAASGINVNYTIVGDTIYFGLESPSTGWTGIGFNPTGDKKEGADMYMFMFDGGKLMANDMVMTKTTGAPKPDTTEGGKDNILTSAGSSSDKGMVVEFNRKLDTKDKTDQPIMVGKVNKVLLAIGEDPSLTKAHKRGARWETEITFK